MRGRLGRGGRGRGGRGAGPARFRRDRPWTQEAPQADRGGRGRGRGRGRGSRRGEAEGAREWKHDRFPKLDPKARLDKGLDSYWMKDEGALCLTQPSAPKS